MWRLQMTTSSLRWPTGTSWLRRQRGSPRLIDATIDQRRNWRLIGRGHRIHWPDVDEDISVASLMNT
jgi:hypothetical protein